MALMEKMNELNNKQRLLVLGIAVAAIGVLFYYLLFAPNQKTINSLKGNLQTIQADVQSLKAIAAKLPEFQDQTVKLQNQLLELRKKLPQDKEIPALLESISKAGMESGLEFELFRPGSEVPKEFYSEVPVNIAVKGPFHNIGMFIDRIVHFPRIVNVTTVQFSSPREEQGFIFINAVGLATTYRYQEKGSGG